MQILNKNFRKRRLLCAAALGTVLTVAGCSGGNGTTNSNGNVRNTGQISFVSVNRALMRMNADGSNVRELLSNGLVEAAAISRNGRKIVYESSQAEDDVFVPVAGMRRIYVMNADGSGKTRVTPGPSDTGPAISPDGNRIVFRRRPLGFSGPSDLFLINAAGTGLRRLTQDDRQKSDFSFSPDGATILFKATLNDPQTGNQSGGLFLLNANATTPATNNERLLVDGPLLGAAAFTPDGRIVFVAPDGIDIIGTDGTSRRNLIPSGNLPGHINRLSVSPDGRSLVYDVRERGSGNLLGIFTQPVNGGLALEILPNNEQPLPGFYPTWGQPAP